MVPNFNHFYLHKKKKNWFLINIFKNSIHTENTKDYIKSYYVLLIKKKLLYKNIKSSLNVY